MGGVDALRGALAHEACLLQAGEHQIQEPVGPVVRRVSKNFSGGPEGVPD